MPRELNKSRVELQAEIWEKIRAYGRQKLGLDRAASSDEITAHLTGHKKETDCIRKNGRKGKEWRGARSSLRTRREGMGMRRARRSVQRENCNGHHSNDRVSVWLSSGMDEKYRHPRQTVDR